MCVAWECIVSRFNRPSSTPIKDNRKYYSSLHFNTYIFIPRKETKLFALNGSKHVDDTNFWMRYSIAKQPTRLRFILS